MLEITRKASDGFNQQTSAFQKHTIGLAGETLSNTFEFGHKMARLREPHELTQAHCEFVRRQAEIVAGQTKGIADSIAKQATQLTSATVRKTAEASEARAQAA
jgi:hypothetical protein